MTFRLESRQVAAALVCCLMLVLCRPAQADDPPSAVGSIMKLLKSGRVPATRLGPILELVCSRGNEHDLAFVYQQALEPNVWSDDLRLKVLDQLADAASTRKVTPTGDLSGLTKLISPEEESDPKLQLAAIRLAGLWNVTDAAPALKSLALNPQAPADLQQAALDALLGLGGDAATAAIDALVAADQPFANRARGVAALASIDLQRAAQLAADALKSAGPQDDPAPVVDALLDRKGGADALAAAIENTPPTGDVAKLALRHMYSVGRSDDALVKILGNLSGMNANPEPPTKEEVAALVQEVNEKGDAARGERVFRRADLSCTKCHAVSKAGGQIGPDLSAVGASSPVDYLVTSVLDPDQAIKEAYTTKIVLTEDGEVFQGLVVDRTDERLVLKDANGKTSTIPVADIEDEVEGKSLMPKGLVKFMTHQELLDVIKFLSMLGKPGTEYAIRSTPRMQRWRVLSPVPESLQSDSANVTVFEDEVLYSTNWLPAYALVNGTLPLDELVAQVKSDVLYVQGEVDVTSAGPIGIRVDSAEGVSLWVDDRDYGSVAEVTHEFPAGRHKITLRIDTRQRAEPGVKLELFRESGSDAEFTVVDGQ
ncbi:hypothetical protein [Maioricimonas sp. JC845]|uniref:hypothetical protein n=1 Tax=Maioricimonas sp. JC845 TaxID=3232138 RepID=UPI0034580BF6